LLTFGRSLFVLMDSQATGTECNNAATCTLVETIDSLVDEFEVFDEWDERYQYLLELGDNLPDMPDDWKTEQNRVEGCRSTVWLVARFHGSGEPRMELIADSDSQIVRGLIAILSRIYNGRTPEEILRCDIQCLFDKLQLRKHLSGARRNGLRSMIQRVHALAARAA